MSFAVFIFSNLFIPFGRSFTQLTLLSSPSQLPQPERLRRGSSSSDSSRSSPRPASRSPRRCANAVSDAATASTEHDHFSNAANTDNVGKPDNLQAKQCTSPIKLLNKNTNITSPKWKNRNLTSTDSDSSTPRSADEKKGGGSKVTAVEQKRSFLKSPFSRRKKTEAVLSTPETPSLDKNKEKTDKTSSNRTINNNRGLTKTPNPGYRPIELQRNPIGKSRKGSSSSSSSSACGLQFTPRDATRTGGIQRRPDAPLMYTGHRSGSPATGSPNTPTSNRTKRDGNKPGSRIPAFSSARGRKTSSGSESEPGLAVEVSDSDEKLSEYRAKAIRGGGGKIPLSRAQQQGFMSHNFNLMSTSATTLPTSIASREIIADLTKDKSNSLPNAQSLHLKHHENIAIARKQNGGLSKAPSPINTRLPVRSAEPAPKSPDTISVKSSSSQRSHKSTTSGSQRSSTGSIQSVINVDRSRADSPQRSPGASQRRAHMTSSVDGSFSPRHSNHANPTPDAKSANRISMVEYENPPVTLEYKTVVRSGGGLSCNSKSSNRAAAAVPSAAAAGVVVAAASCQTDENVTGLGLRGEDLAEINTDTQQPLSSATEVSQFSSLLWVNETSSDHHRLGI